MTRSPVFDAPLDTLYVWVGLGAVSLLVAGTVLSFPTASPAAAGSVADAVDTVAASEFGAREDVEVPAGDVRLGPHTLALRTDGGQAHARFEFGPVTPVRDGPLRAVLTGTPPREAFGTRSAFREAIDRAQYRDHGFRDGPRRLIARRVRWGEVSATLVG